MIGFAGIKKLCAIVTAVCFTVSVLNGNLFASINNNSVSNNSLVQEFEKFISSKNKQQIESLFSEKYGKLLSYKDNNSDTVVINIQDLHCDYSVQKNIYFLIEELSKKYKIDNVFVEGGIGTINTEIFSQINPQYKKNVLENLLKSGRLTGTEYYNALNDKKDFLKGVEDEKTYLQNIVRLSEIINAKQETLNYLSKIEKEIEFLKSKYLTSKNKKFNVILDKYENGEISQEKFFSYLLKFAEQNDINVSKYKNLQTYLSLFSSPDYNNKKLTKEFAELINEIKTSLPYAQYKKILNLTSNLTDIKALKLIIDGYCDIRNLNIEKKFPNVNKFLSAQQNYSSFNPVELVKEERTLVDVIRTYLSENQTELEIAYIGDFKQFYKGYITASLTSAQWEYVKLGLDKFKELYAKYSVLNEVSQLDVYSKLLSEFYDVNINRNYIFIDKMGLSKNGKRKNSVLTKNLSDILSDAKSIIVLVAGGYHTEGINEILNKNNISNVTITPELSNSNTDTRTAYENLVSQQAMSIKQMIALGLISNATQKEQILAVVNSLLSNQNLDGINIDILVQQLNNIFDQNIQISLSNENQQLDFIFADGSKETVDINEDIKNIIEDQNVTKLSSIRFVKLTGEKLKEITDVVLKTTFNFGQEIFAPQMYQISKDICLFMVNNKWYLGSNGTIWEIANSSYDGQSLDGVDPVEYEYMPEMMQHALLEKQKNNDRKFNIKKVIDKAKKALVSVMIVVTLLSMPACSMADAINNPSEYAQQQTNEYVDQSAENIMYFKDSGSYRFLSYNVDAMTQEDMAEWNERDFRDMSTLINTYDQSLTVVTLLKMGETEKAKQTMDEIYKFYKRFNKIYKSNQEYYEITGEIVWVGIAAVQYKLETGSHEYDELISAVDNYLVQRKSQYGYIFGSESNMISNGGYSSTEHMLDVIAYLNLKTLLPDNDNVEADKELLLTVATFTTEDLMYQDTDRFMRGYRDDKIALDTYSWGLQVFSALKKYNPEIYEQCGFGNKDLDKIIRNVERDFRIDFSNKKDTKYFKGKVSQEEYEMMEKYHLYSWSDQIWVDKDKKTNLYLFQDLSNSEINFSFEWSLQMAATYYLMGDYEMAQTIFDDATTLAKELGFEDGIYPASNLNNVYNYESYGWLVGRVPSLSATCTAALLEYSFMKGDPELGSPFYPVNDPLQGQTPSSILPQAINEINSLIKSGKFSMKAALIKIISSETVKSLFSPVSYIDQHVNPSAKLGATILVSVTALAAIIAASILSFFALNIIFVFVDTVAAAVFVNVTTHMIIDFRYLKSSGLRQAIALYGKDSVSLSKNGVEVEDKDKIINMYVINDRPQNFKDFNFKPVSTKIKTQDGKFVKCWLGRYNGVAVVFAQGASYESIVKEFSQTKQFESVYGRKAKAKTQMKANIDIIEVDMVNTDSSLRYGENGNIIVGVDVLKTNDLLDLKKEFSLINNKKIDAITINQNIAVFIDEDIDTISSYDDMLSIADLYVKDTGLGTETKVLFSDKYINKIIDLIRQDVSKSLTSQHEIEQEVKNRFISIIQSAKSSNKDISVVFENVDDKTDLTKYFEYGIFSYIANGKYFDSITSAVSQAKFVTNLDEIKSFDGSISVIKVSAFKNEIEKTSGIFTFLNSSLKIKEILEQRNIEFVKRAASNFDFNSIPPVDNNVIVEIINSAKENKYELLSKYLNEADAVSMYYSTLSGNKERNAFIESILERMLAVNLLRSNDINLGLREHKLEEILAKALYVKYTTGIGDNIKSSLTFDVSQMTAAQAEQALMETISKLADEAFVQNKPEAINDIIELIPLYADRVSDFRAESVEVINVQNIRGILSAA